MKEIVIATKNPGKFGEIKEVVGNLGVKFLSLRDFAIDADVIEDADTFEGNAIKKAEFFYDLVQRPVIAEDSGLLVDALPGELGVKTRRWGKGESASDEQWIEHFMQVMSVFSDDERGASFVCVAVFFDGKTKQFFKGSTKGCITHSLEAPIKAGLPLSSCFRPDGFEKVYASLAVEEKSKISHRGKALHQLRDFLLEYTK